MDESRLNTIAQAEEFLRASAPIGFSARGVPLACLRHTSGYSRAQISRLVQRWRSNRLAPAPLSKRCAPPRAPFARKYTSADVALLVEMDRAHEDVCGPAIAHRLLRAYRVYGDARQERLAQLPVAHLDNLRKSAGCQAQRVSFTKTRPVCNPIGVRRPPRPNGRAGFVRIDTARQGGLDGTKGVYHITCTDAVSQWRPCACCPLCRPSKSRDGGRIAHGYMRTIGGRASGGLAGPVKVESADGCSFFTLHFLTRSACAMAGAVSALLQAHI